jgi:tRNA-splicing ligase RtcB
MGTPGYVVRGKGVAASLKSASHGAGRRMSRKKAKELFSWNAVQGFLRERSVTLLSAGLDEVPMAYKDIDAVMAAQHDLVEPLARFEPKLVIWRRAANHQRTNEWPPPAAGAGRLPAQPPSSMLRFKRI